MTNRSSTDAPAKSRTYRLPPWEAAVMLCAAIALLVGIAATFRQVVNKPPFEMTIEPDGDHAILRFVHPGRHRISAPFTVPLRLDSRHEIVLDSSTRAIPGGHIEFSDTTLLPGRFKIRFGETHFDVMDRAIEFDGRPTEWLVNDSWE